MNYLERADARYIAEATDDSERGAAIERFSKARQRSYQLAIIFTLCFLATFVWDFLYPTAFGAIGAIGAGLGTVMEWVKTMKFTSDLRLLKVVDRLKR
jgi:hypothetical protein